MTSGKAGARPFLKWAGGKGQLLAQYATHFPTDFGTYFEPFCGGGAVFFHLAPARAVLSDINPELVNVYQCVRDAVEDVITLLGRHATVHNVEHYYATRALAPATLAPVERAARLIYLNRTCFNGLYRENAHGEFNVPIGRYQHPTICDHLTLRAASAALRDAQSLVASFDGVLDRAQPGDLVYCDPPYAPVSVTSSFTSYSRHPFGEREQTRLRDVVVELGRRGVRAIISNSDTPLTKNLYRDLRVVPIAAQRAINSRPDRRGVVSELLAFNW